MKRCGKCKIEKPVEKFSKNKSTKDGLYSLCKECKKEQAKGYRLKNKKKISKKLKKYYEINKEKISSRKKKMYQQNKDVVSERCKQYYLDNVDEIKVNKRKYSKVYTQTESGRVVNRRKNHKRRVLKFQGTYEVFDSVEIFERDGYRCQICGKKTRPDYKNCNHPLYPNLDHIIPLSKGGDHTRENTQCLCHLCNTVKGNNYDGEDFKLTVYK